MVPLLCLRPLILIWVEPEMGPCDLSGCIEIVANPGYVVRYFAIRRHDACLKDAR
jgi:hypothetical protein